MFPRSIVRHPGITVRAEGPAMHPTAIECRFNRGVFPANFDNIPAVAQAMQDEIRYNILTLPSFANRTMNTFTGYLRVTTDGQQSPDDPFFKTNDEQPASGITRELLEKIVLSKHN